MNIYQVDHPNMRKAQPDDIISLIIAAPDEPRAITEAIEHTENPRYFRRAVLTRIGTGPGPVRVILDSRRTTIDQT